MDTLSKAFSKSLFFSLPSFLWEKKCNSAKPHSYTSTSNIRMEAFSTLIPSISYTHFGLLRETISESHLPPIILCSLIFKHFAVSFENFPVCLYARLLKNVKIKAQFDSSCEKVGRQRFAAFSKIWPLTILRLLHFITLANF